MGPTSTRWTRHGIRIADLSVWEGLAGVRGAPWLDCSGGHMSGGLFGPPLDQKCACELRNAVPIILECSIHWHRKWFKTERVKFKILFRESWTSGFTCEILNTLRQSWKTWFTGTLHQSKLRVRISKFCSVIMEIWVYCNRKLITLELFVLCFLLGPPLAGLMFVCMIVFLLVCFRMFVFLLFSSLWLFMFSAICVDVVFFFVV